MLFKKTNLKPAFLFFLIGFVLISCGNDDNPSDPSQLGLPERIISNNALTITAPIVWDALKIHDPNIRYVTAYLGDYAPENFLGTLRENNQSLEFPFPISLETKDRFIEYSSLSPNFITCNPSNLARSKSPVRFFTIKDDQKQYEVFLAQTNEENSSEFNKEYQIYFWSEKGTANGTENGYTCNYDVDKGWNITEIDGNHMRNAQSIKENLYFVIREN